MKTIRMVRNMNYLTERLPKPNYSPVRYRSMREISDGYHNDKRMNRHVSDVIPKLSKSLNMYELNNFERSSLNLNSSSNYDKKKYNKEELGVPVLPAIKNKGGKRYWFMKFTYFMNLLYYIYFYKLIGWGITAWRSSGKSNANLSSKSIIFSIKMAAWHSRYVHPRMCRYFRTSDPLHGPANHPLEIIVNSLPKRD